MSGPDGVSDRGRVVVAASADLVVRLQALLPGAELVGATPTELPASVATVHARVAVCVADDADACLVALRRVAATRADVRTLSITPASAVDERLAALESGADDAVAMPIADSELAGRIRILLQRGRRQRISRLPVGVGMELDLDRRVLLQDGFWVHLRPKEARLLELFAQAPGRVMTRSHILDRVWGPNHTSDPRTVDVHVRWLRSKIEPDPRHPTWLQTVPGVGYRLEPALTER